MTYRHVALGIAALLAIAVRSDQFTESGDSLLIYLSSEDAGYEI